MSTQAGQGTGRFNVPALIVALAILVSFGWLMYHLFQVAPTQEEALWNRSMTLFGSLEALAFTAAGYIFGKEVHREQAQKAEARADAKTTEAHAAGAAAAHALAKGESLKKAIEARHGSASRTDMSESVRGQSGLPDARGDLSELVTLAQSLFP
jgi:hypothetical protein